MSPEITLQNKKIIESQAMNIKTSNITKVKMPYVIKSSLQEMNQQAVDTNIKIGLLKRDLSMFTNSSRDSDRLGADQPEPEVSDDFSIKNLVFTGQKSPFSDMVLSSNLELSLSGDTRLLKMQTNKITIDSNMINEISMSEFTKIPVDGKVSGDKVASRVKIKHLKIDESLNRIPIKTFLNKTTSNPTSLTMQGNIEVENMFVKILNGIDFDKFINDVYVVDGKKQIDGNLIISNAVKVDQLTVDQINEVPVNNLMTTSTEQVVHSNVAIDKFYAQSIISETFNGEKLIENVAVLGQENFIEGKSKFASKSQSIDLIKFNYFSSN